MDIKLIPTTQENPKLLYVVTVDTMEGDADDYHEFEITTESTDELKEIIIGMSILANAYPNGRGGCDEYCGKFYEEYVSGELYNYEGFNDSIQSFSVKYYNEKGKEFDVQYTIDEEMQNRIDIADGLTPKEIKEMELPVLSKDNKELIQIMFDKITQDFKEKFDNGWTHDQYPNYNDQPDYKTSKSYVLDEMYQKLRKKSEKISTIPRDFFAKLAKENGFVVPNSVYDADDDNEEEEDDE